MGRVLKNIELRNFLKDYNNLDMYIKNIKFEIENISITGIDTTIENTGKTNKINSSVENSFEKIEKLQRELRQLELKKKKIENVIACLSSFENDIFLGLTGKMSNTQLSIKYNVTVQNICKNKNLLLNKINRLAFLGY
ncbi:hypothetical protein ACHM2L_15360 [Clostridium perfringens]|uniref:hypothetical protein n=1 Tax=Clostridium perfringens TaxID=1502 RepID=UPI0028E0D095|nr:hypothetical protein [Clostridium perfringens]MDM0993078.1 hypothetical protein [Clostridium perfringens]MDT9334679.1 hypothetical protein [Clostridium perfringens]